MTIEIHELEIQLQVTDPPPSLSQLPANSYTEWNKQQLLEELKQELIDYFLERGHL